MWLGRPDTTPFIELQKSQKSIVSQNKLISVEEIFQGISR